MDGDKLDAGCLRILLAKCRDARMAEANKWDLNVSSIVTQGFYSQVGYWLQVILENHIDDLDGIPLKERL